MIDIYIDEDKVNGYIGFLIVRNTPYIQQILYNKRQKFDIYYELHYKSVNNMAIQVYKSWINLFVHFQEIYELGGEFCDFIAEDWNGKGQEKEEVILEIIGKISQDYNTKNIVVFLDFDTEHKKSNLENTIYRKLQVMRVYHLNSKATDLLQLSDILLGSFVRSKKGELSSENFFKIDKKIKEGKNCTKGELKSFLGNYFIKQINKKKMR